MLRHLVVDGHMHIAVEKHHPRVTIDAEAVGAKRAYRPLP
jgi:hypothetical protein